MLEIADDVTDVVLEVAGGTAGLVGDAIGGADELVKGARRAGLRRLLSLVVVVVVILAVVGWLRSRQPDDAAGSAGA